MTSSGPSNFQSSVLLDSENRFRAKPGEKEKEYELIPASYACEISQFTFRIKDTTRSLTFCIKDPEFIPKFRELGGIRVKPLTDDLISLDTQASSVQRSSAFESTISSTSSTSELDVSSKAGVLQHETVNEEVDVILEPKASYVKLNQVKKLKVSNGFFASSAFNEFMPLLHSLAQTGNPSIRSTTTLLIQKITDNHDLRLEFGFAYFECYIGFQEKGLYQALETSWNGLFSKLLEQDELKFSIYVPIITKEPREYFRSVNVEKTIRNSFPQGLTLKDLG